MAPFVPVVEPKSVPNAFLTENPWNQNVVSDVPWIVGSTSSEGADMVTSTSIVAPVFNLYVASHLI